MTETFAFPLGALALLATPGPTNTLLATSGAISGFRKSLGLLAGELLGYLLAITVLRTAVGPLILAIPALGTVLSALVVSQARRSVGSCRTRTRRARRGEGPLECRNAKVG